MVEYRFNDPASQSLLQVFMLKQHFMSIILTRFPISRYNFESGTVGSSSPARRKRAPQMPSRPKQSARASHARAATSARRVSQAPASAAHARAATPARRVSQAPARPTRRAAVRPTRQVTPPVSRTATRHRSPSPEGRTVARRATARPATRVAVRRTVARPVVARPVRETVERLERRPLPQPSRRAKEVVAQAPEAPPTCVHEWVIEPPNGPTSQGKCRRCDEVRAFRNSLDITYWDTQRHGAGAARRKPATPPAMPARRA